MILGKGSHYFWPVKQLILFFTIFSMLLEPLWPLVEYMANYDYIVSVLCENRDAPEMNCNGKCYLSKMPAEQKRQQDKNPFETFQLRGEQLPIIFMEIRDIDLSMNRFAGEETPFANRSTHLHDCLFVFELIQPPEA